MNLNFFAFVTKIFTLQSLIDLMHSPGLKCFPAIKVPHFAVKRKVNWGEVVTGENKNGG